MDNVIELSAVPAVTTVDVPAHPLLAFLQHTENSHFIQFQCYIALIQTQDDLVRAVQVLLAPLPETTHMPQRLQYIQAQIQILLQDEVIVQDLLRLIALIRASTCTTFSDFIQTLQTKFTDTDGREMLQYPAESDLYQLLENLLYPCLHGDHQLIFNELKKSNYTPRMILPPQFSAYDTNIAALNGSPLSNLTTQTWLYAITFAPSSLGNIAASQLTVTPPLYRLVISLAPIALGGFLRFLCARQVGMGQGRDTALVLFFISTLGLAGTFVCVELADLSQITPNSTPYTLLLISNMVAGVGGAVFTICASDTAQTSSNDNKVQWLERLRLLGITPNQFDQSMASFSRGTPAANIGKMGGLGSLSPSFALLISAYLLPIIGNTGVYGSLTGLTVLGFIAACYRLHPPILDQLRHQGIEESTARAIAKQLGQPQLLSNPHITYLQALGHLNRKDWIEVGRSSLNYSAGFGLYIAAVATAGLMLTGRGLPPKQALLYTAIFSGIGALTRSLAGFPPRHNRPIITTSVAVGMMAVSAFTFAKSRNPQIWLPAFFTLSITSGVLNFSVFDEIAQNLSPHLGLATGVTGAIGAISAVFFSLGFMFISTTNHINEQQQSETNNEYYFATAVLGLTFCINLLYWIKRASHKPNATLQLIETHDPDIERPAPRQLVTDRYRFYQPIGQTPSIHSIQNRELGPTTVDSSSDKIVSIDDDYAEPDLVMN